MPDANIDQAVDGIIGAAYGSANERCMAVSVLIAVGDIADDLVLRFQINLKALKLLHGHQFYRYGTSNI